MQTDIPHSTINFHVTKVLKNTAGHAFTLNTKNLFWMTASNEIERSKSVNQCNLSYPWTQNSCKKLYETENCVLLIGLSDNSFNYKIL